MEDFTLEEIRTIVEKILEIAANSETESSKEIAILAQHILRKFGDDEETEISDVVWMN